MKLTRFFTVSNLFTLEVGKKCQRCQLCVLRKNSIVLLSTQEWCDQNWYEIASVFLRVRRSSKKSEYQHMKGLRVASTTFHSLLTI